MHATRLRLSPVAVITVSTLPLKCRDPSLGIVCRERLRFLRMTITRERS